MENLYQHALMRTIMTDIKPSLEDVVPALKQNLAETGRFRLKTPLKPPPREQYCLEMFRYCMRLISAFERLTCTQTYILNFPKNKSFKSGGITQDKWVEYHYCNYLITLSGLYDVALVITGAAFRTGIDPKHCNDKVILDNHWIKSTPVKPALKNLLKAIEPHKMDRNAYIHHGVVPVIDAIDDLKPFSFIEQFGAAEEIGLDVRTLRKAYTIAVKTIADEMQPTITKVMDATVKLFDVLLPVYSAHAKSLASTR